MTDEPIDDVSDEPEEPGSVTDKQLNELVDAWLAEVRPDRYDGDDKEWMETVIAKAREAILLYRSTEEALDEAAKRLVHGREGQAVRSTHTELRRIAKSGQLPIGWGGDRWTDNPFFVHLLSLPLKIAGERVRWGAMSPDDWKDWELENAREEDEDRVRRIEARRGAKLIQDIGREQGVQRTEDIRPPATGA